MTNDSSSFIRNVMHYVYVIIIYVCNSFISGHGILQPWINRAESSVRTTTATTMQITAIY